MVSGALFVDILNEKDFSGSNLGVLNQ